jgi:hypothetical protein
MAAEILTIGDLDWFSWSTQIVGCTRKASFLT